MKKRYIILLLSFVALIFSGCKVSGKITENNEGVAGITVKLSGDAAMTTVTDPQGKYEFSVSNGSYIVAPVPADGEVFIPSGKQVFVRVLKNASADFNLISGNEKNWDPSVVVPIQVYPERRGKKIMRGIIHLHSIYSHDACDNKPWIDGKPNAECYDQLRDAICSTNQQFVMLSDHPDNLAYHEFPAVLLYQPDRGDELVYRNDMPVANIIDCGCGNKTIVTAGCEGGLMPLGLKKMPEGTVEDRMRVLNGKDVAAVEKLKELGASVFVTHPESWKTEDLLAIPIEGIDIYNLHANIDPNIRKDYLGLPSIGFLPDLLNMLFPTWNPSHSDLFLLSFFSENAPDINHWDRMLAFRPTVGILATDAHRNALPFPLPDGDRADSYRRMMKWFANYILAEDQSLESIEDAVAKGRMYGAFQVFGEPVGFDYYAATAEGNVEMGGSIGLSSAPVLHVSIPSFFAMPALRDNPELVVLIIRADSDGAKIVAESINADIDYTPDVAGAYRVEVRITPYHLKKWLGYCTEPFIKEYPLIYANPIYIK